MATLVRPRAWGQQKPPPGSQIDWGHPLAEGLAFCSLLNEHAPGTLDLVTGQWLTGSVTSTQGSRSDGPKFTSASSQSLKNAGYTGPAMSAPSSGGYTIAARYNGSGGNFASTEIAAFGNFSGFKGTYLGFDNNQIPVFRGCDNIGGIYSCGTGAAAAAGVDGFYVGVYRFAVDQRIYAGGVLKGTTSSILPANVAPGTVPSIGQRGDGDYFDGSVGYAAYWTRPLSASEVAWLAAEPFAFIVPPGPKSRSFALSASAPAYTSNVTMSLGVTIPIASAKTASDAVRVLGGLTVPVAGTKTASDTVHAPAGLTIPVAGTKGGTGTVAAPAGNTTKTAGSKAANSNTRASLASTITTAATKAASAVIRWLAGLTGLATVPSSERAGCLTATVTNTTKVVATAANTAKVTASAANTATLVATPEEC